MKKTLAIILALVICLSLLPMSALAEEEFVIENGVLVKYNGDGGDVVIPEGVTAIGDEAFSFCHDLTSVVIPEGVTVIGRRSFDFCENMSSVVIPESVTVIGDGAFSLCESLTSVIIPEGVTAIGAQVFEACHGLTSVTIPESVTSIGNYAFYECYALTDVTIPASVTSVGTWAFSWCVSLTSVTIPDSLTEISGYMFAWCSSLTSVTIPASVTYIDWYAFHRCSSLTDVYYGGSETQWAQIETELFNDILNSAVIHFMSTEPETPEIPGLFTDVKSGMWYESAVSFAVENGLMYGVDNGKFDPDGTTTRAQLMTILARLDGADTEGGNPWYEKAMTWAKEKEISDGTDPDGYLTREQLATMLWRYAGKPETDAGYDAFSDADSVHDWAAQAMAWAVEQGIITGDNGRLKPQDTATRAEMAAMLMRFCNSLEK